MSEWFSLEDRNYQNDIRIRSIEERWWTKCMLATNTILKMDNKSGIRLSTKHVIYAMEKVAMLIQVLIVVG